MKTLCIPLLLLLHLLALGCAGHNGRVAGPPLEKEMPVVYIHPLTGSYQQATVGVLPFQLPPGVRAEEGIRVAALFKDILLGRRVFPVVRQLTAEYGDLEEALALGREAGVDLVLAGRISQLLAGTPVGGARARVAVRLLDTDTGHTVWYVEQAMRQKMEEPDFGFVGRLRSSMAVQPLQLAATSPAVPNMLTRMAVDLADVLQGARSVSR